MGLALLYGIVIWVIMTYVALPIVNPTMRHRVAMMPGAFFLEHLLFGLGVGLGPMLRRRFAHAVRRTRLGTR